MDIKLELESEGKKINISKNDDVKLLRIEGIGEIVSGISSRPGISGDGSFVEGVRIEPRNILIEGEFSGEHKRVNRKKLTSFFNSHKDGRLFLFIDTHTYVIEYTTESFDAPLTNVNKPLKFLAQLYCPNPYWQSPDLTVEPLAPFVETFEFPSDYWEQGEDGDLYFEVGFEGEKRELTVHGDVESPVQIRFYGPSTNPVIRNNTTDKFIKVNRTLNADDTLFIDTEDSIVTINGENVFNWIDINSTFWKLQEGANEIEYTADAGVADAKLEIMWNEKYVGV